MLKVINPCSPASLRLIAICLVASSVSRGEEEQPRTQSKVNDQGTSDSVADLIRDMRICLVEPGTPSSPVKLASVPFQGDLNITRLCCQNSVIGGLAFDSDVVPDTPGAWSGSSRLSFKLDSFSTHCQADWVLTKYDHKGSVTLELAQNIAAPAPFIDIKIDIAGAAIPGDGDMFPFPSKTTSTQCATNFLIKKLVFSGPLQTIVNLLNRLMTTGPFQSMLRPIICSVGKISMPKAIDKALHDVRASITPMMSNLSPDLDPPAAPEGAGPSIDLSSASLPLFTHRLFQQGLTTGDMGKLIKRITGGTGNIAIKLPEPFKLTAVDVQHPTNLSMDVMTEGVTIDGVHTIDHIDLAASKPHEMTFRLAQDSFDLAVSLRTLSTVPKTAGVSTARRLLNALLERFTLDLKLSDVDLSVRAGLLLDKEKVSYLLGGQSWYQGDCALTMVQAVNVTGMDVKVTVQKFSWIQPEKAPSELEAEFDQSVNNLLKYLNDPWMQKTVSRLVRSFAADNARDVVNSQLAEMLRTPPGSPCKPKFGVGSAGAFTWLAVFGGIAAAVALGLSIFWCARRFRTGKRKYVSRFALFLAVSGLSMVNGGLLGYPFRAGVRLHNGGAHAGVVDDILYMFVMGVQDVITWIPAGVALTVMSLVLFGSARFAAVIMATLTHYGPRSSNFVRWFSAIGTWDLAVPFIFAGTQIASFYAKIIGFGDSYADMGVQINPGFYVMALGYIFLDVASICVYSFCCVSSAKSVVERCQSKGTHVPHAQVPHVAALIGLALAILALLIAPWLILWSHTYEGLMGRALHYQSDTETRDISIFSIICDTQKFLLNPFSVGMGAVIMQWILIVNVIVAPILHAALALFTGIYIRKKTFGAALPWGTSDQQIRGESSFASCDAEFQDGGSTPMSAKQIGGVVIRYALMITRMWAGADAFAVFMFIYVPSLRNQLIMMSEQACDPVIPVLNTLGKMGYEHECYTLTSTFGPGLPVLLLAGITARICAEFGAHRPLRSRRYDQVLNNRHLQIPQPQSVSLAEQSA